MVQPPVFPRLVAVLAPALPEAFPASEAACVALAFAVGATIGSFLNVVVHRVPQGRSVVSGRSRCPACGSGIRWHDNIPILGWLLLRGRCRDCGSPIAVRYPLVEAGAGCLAALLAAATLLEAGNTDGWHTGTGGGPVIDRLLLRGDWRPVAFWLHRTIVVMALLAWTLLVAAGHPVPGATLVVGTLLAGLTAAVVPGLGPRGIDLALVATAVCLACWRMLRPAGRGRPPDAS